MTGFNSLFIALKPTVQGNCEIQAVMGPDTIRFANLEPVDAAAPLKGKPAAETGGSLTTALLDSAEALTADVWNIYYLQDQLAGQKNMQFKLTNNVGTNNTIEFGFMRLV